MKFNYKQLIFICLFPLLSCATYYEVNQEFNRYFEQGELEEADRILEKNKKLADSKEKLLYLVNRGVVLSMMGEYSQSNDYLEDAYLYSEDYHKNYINIAASYLTNPSFVAYKGEDHELLLILYYKALNYLQMGEYNSALVECKRLNIRLQQLSDKYKSEKKYQRDAFIHTLMGIIYDAQKDYNNAFIAYRNALEIYQNDYSDMFKVPVPDQLKEDILRTAFLTGFKEEYDQYKKKFAIDYDYEPSEGSDLVFFWNNGLGPVKSEWSINFAVVKGEGGVFNITNDEFGFSFPFKVSDEEDRSDLSDLRFFRVAFPKYIERTEFYQTGYLKYNGGTYQLELAEDINAIAFKTLQERMLLEFGKSLLRVALKKAAEKQAEKESDGFATAVSFLNAVTEKADTRNWQTLPHSIYYTRIPLRQGNNTVSLGLHAPNGKNEERTFSYDVQKGETAFQTFYSLEYKYFGYQ